MTRFYAADLAAYNNGRLHGVWIIATSDADEMAAQVATMLRASPYPNVMVDCPECEGDGTETDYNGGNGGWRRVPCSGCKGKGELPSAEEWVVHDFDDAHGAIRHLGETSDLAAIAAIMEAVEAIESDHDDAHLPMLINWLTDCGYAPEDWADKLEEAFAGVWTDPEDYAAEQLEGSLDALPDNLKGYFDYKAFARDLALGGDMDFICTSTGAHLQDYDSMRGRECIALHCH